MNHYNPLFLSMTHTSSEVRLRFPRGLYGITPEWDDTARLLDAVRAAHEGGMHILQWRRKQTPPATQLQDLVALCAELALPFIINDDWTLARDLHTAGAHLGKNDGVLKEARAGLAAEQWLGCSCYNDLALAQQGLLLGVDYVAFGTAYPSAIKPDAPRANLATYQQGRALCEQHANSEQGRAAVVAIGGITAANAAPLVEAGVDSIAMISSLFEAKDIYAEAKAVSELFL